MKRTGLAGRTREAIRFLTVKGREVTSAALTIELDMISDKEKQTLYRVIRDFVKSGEITRIRRGAYIYNGKNKPPELQAIMWRYLRAKRTVTIDDLVAISRASLGYASGWIYMLERRKIVEKVRTAGARKYRMISDPVIMPEDEEKAKKQRDLRREKKRAALDALRAADISICTARKAIGEL